MENSEKSGENATEMDSRSESLANWATIAHGLGVVSLVAFFYKKWAARQEKKKQLRLLIGLKYYEVIQIVKHLKFEANKVCVEDMAQLRRVNQLLKQFTPKAFGTLNFNKSTDIETTDIGRYFSDKAADCLLSLQQLFVELDNECREKWQGVCSGNVVSLTNRICIKWEELLIAIAPSRFFGGVDKLKQEFDERARGL